jgi:hypothetical protein
MALAINLFNLQIFTQQAHSISPALAAVSHLGKISLALFPYK